MWKRGAIFMAFRQAAQLKPLANRILRNFHHVPNSLSEYAGHSNFEPRLVLVHLALSCCVQLCSSLSKIFKVWLRRSVEELMNQQLDDVWKLRFPEKMWHFVVFSPSGPSDSAMSLPSGRCADRETFSVSLAKTPRVAGGEERLFPKI